MIWFTAFISTFFFNVLSLTYSMDTSRICDYSLGVLLVSFMRFHGIYLLILLKNPWRAFGLNPLTMIMKRGSQSKVLDTAYKNLTRRNFFSCHRWREIWEAVHFVCGCHFLVVLPLLWMVKMSPVTNSTLNDTFWAIKSSFSSHFLPACKDHLLYLRIERRHLFQI